MGHSSPENTPLSGPKPLRMVLHLEMDVCDWHFLMGVLIAYRDNSYLKKIDKAKAQMLINKLTSSLREP